MTSDFSAVSAGLCAGIAGFEAPLHRHGWRAKMVAEIDPAARAVLTAHLGSGSLTGDVREIEDLPAECKLVACGFPCKDISQAGRMQGIDGPNSRIVREVFRLLARRPIEHVLIENVPNLLFLDSGAGVQLVTSAFTRLGYRWAYRLVDNLTFGLPQRRLRFVLAATLNGDPRDVLLADDAGARPRQDLASARYQDGGLGFYWTEGLRGVGVAHRAIPPLKAGSTLGIPSAPAIIMPDGFVGTPAIEDAERLQGFAPGWTEPGAAVARGSRWRLVGNALPTVIADWLGHRLRYPGCYDAAHDRPLGNALRWPAAAWDMADGSGIHASAASDNPLGQAAPAIANFIQFALKPLSARATSGFLSRAGRSTLSFPPGMIRALEGHLADGNARLSANFRASACA